MTQRYFAITPSQGCNFYLNYPVQPPTAPTILGPSNFAQLGIEPGTHVFGNLNTQWVFVVAGATAITAGSAVNFDPATFTVGGTGGSSGTPLVAVAAGSAGTGLWVETTGATLNLAPATLAEPEKAGEKAADKPAHPAGHTPASGSGSASRSKAA